MFDFFRINPIINSSCIIRKELCYWNHEWTGVEDYDLWLKLRKQEKTFYNCSELLVKHRIHKTSAFNANGNNNLVDDLKLLLSGLLTPLKSEEYLGQAEVRQIFKITNVGKIAGCFVTGGVIKRNGKARLVRDSIVIHDGILKTLKRFKEDAKEVKNGFECGIAFENFEDIFINQGSNVKKLLLIYYNKQIIYFY
jgi:translation initiation factor IF-2